MNSKKVENSTVNCVTNLTAKHCTISDKKKSNKEKVNGATCPNLTVFVAFFPCFRQHSVYLRTCVWGDFLTTRYLDVSLVAVFVKRKQWPPSWRHSTDVGLLSGL